MSYRAPVAEILSSMRAVAGPGGIAAHGSAGMSSETIAAIVEEAGRFAADKLAPLNSIGDRCGATFKDGRVATPPGWREAYRLWARSGWSGLGAPADLGGQDLPVLVQMAVQEIWHGANTAFATGPMLIVGAIDAIRAHGSEALQRRYLPPLVSGAALATMSMTEPRAGSDLGAIATRAERAGDSGYRIFGQKIFITYGDHDLTDNIIHLVLARLPDAPAGTDGISMFLVPKLLPGRDGEPTAGNDVTVAGIERKLGLHGAPTCTMVYGEGGDGAVGWLIGEENRGLAAMFTMMNVSRLAVGAQAVGVAERATQTAIAFARTRRQGHTGGDRTGTVAAIIEHPDIQRELLGMTALTAASRLICYACANAFDLSRTGAAAGRGAAADRAGLLTPVAKAFATDAAIAVASAAIQVHGGAGYIEETGVAQCLRDARVFAIYEGTNGIQAIDLVKRKLRLAGGAPVRLVIDEIAGIAAQVAAVEATRFGKTGQLLAAAAGHASAATGFLIGALAGGRTNEALAGATPYLRLFALAYGGGLLAKAALDAPPAEAEAAIAIARFFAETFLGETAALDATVRDGAEGLRAAARALFPSAAGQDGKTGYA